MEIFSQASPNTGDVVGIHLPAAKKVGRVTHVFKAKEGRLEKERVCIDDCVDLTEVYDMKELVKRQFGLVGEQCIGLGTATAPTSRSFMRLRWRRRRNGALGPRRFVMEREVRGRNAHQDPSY